VQGDTGIEQVDLLGDIVERHRMIAVAVENLGGRHKALPHLLCALALDPAQTAR